MIHIKTLIPLIGLIGFVFPAKAQNCQLSNEQQEVIRDARDAISISNSNPDYNKYMNVIDKCSKAIELASYCPDISDLYDEGIRKSTALAKSGDDLELYFYEQAIKFCEQALRVITVPEKKAAYKKDLEQLNDAYRLRKQAIANTYKQSKDDNDFKQAKSVDEHFNKNLTNTNIDKIINRYIEYIYAFPNGAHVRDADNAIFETVKKSNNIEYYKKYLHNLPNGVHSDEAKKNIISIQREIDRPKDNAAFAEANLNGKINAYEEYLNQFPDGFHLAEAKNKIADLYADLYIEKGDSCFAAANYQLSLNYYNKVSDYSYSKNIGSKISSAKEMILYNEIKKSDNVEKRESYLNLYPDGKFKNEVTSELCFMYGNLAKTYKKNKNNEDALRYYSKITTLSCDTKSEKEAQSEINSINRSIKRHNDQIKRQKWNDSFKDDVYYSYIFQSPTTTNSGNTHGILVSYLKNKKIGYYYSFRANADFLKSKINLSDLNENNISLISKTDSCTSSALLSFGITKKIYRPFFITAGLGIGMNTFSYKYQIQSDAIHSLWLYSNDDRGYYFAPEIGLHIAFPYFTISGRVNYLLPFKKSEKFEYKNISYSLGAGIGLSSTKIYHQSKHLIYLAYCFDFPNPSYLDFKTNSSIYGISVGALKGFYGTVRVNSLYFSKKYVSPEEKGNMFVTAGYGNRLLYPLYFYIGAGVLHQKDIFNEDKWKFNPEIGLNFLAGHIVFRGGVNIPSLECKYNNIYYSCGLGYVF